MKDALSMAAPVFRQGAAAGAAVHDSTGGTAGPATLIDTGVKVREPAAPLFPRRPKG